MPGVNDNRRVPCSVSVHHGHFPSNERCPCCAPPVVKAWVPPSSIAGHYERLRGFKDRREAERKLIDMSVRYIVSDDECRRLYDWIEENYPS